MTLPAPAATFVPSANPVSILTSASPLPEGVASFDRWRGGLSQRNVYGARSGVWPVGCVTEGDKGLDDTSGVSEFQPFGVYVSHGCDGKADPATYTAEASAALDAKLAFHVARELWTGSVSGNPSLQDNGSLVTTGAEPVVYAADLLIDAFLNETSGARPTLHAPIVAVGPLIAAGYMERVGDRLVTPHGYTVVTGPGYPGSGAWGPTGADPADPGEAYMYVTGTVELGLGDVQVLDAGAGIGARQNLVNVVVERLVMLRFPPVPVFAALASVT